jgi:tetratricopeptide (TPR) repeat protein
MPSRTTASVPPGSSAPGSLDARRGPPQLAPGEAVSVAACSALVDRLAAGDEWAFLAGWLENVLAGRQRMEPTLAVRLVRAYRETGRLERARDLAASLPSAPVAWNAIDGARLAIERATLATIDGRGDHAEAELRVAARALSTLSKGTGLREQLEFHLTQAQLDVALHRGDNAVSALRLAEHLAERLEEGAWRAPVGMTLGDLAMRLSDPRAAIKHYAWALAAATARGNAAMGAHGSLALALGMSGRFEEARQHAAQAGGIARELGAAWRHADAQDILATVEIWAEHPQAAMGALDEALVALGDIDHPTLRYHLAEHRTWVLAMLGRVQPAQLWLGRVEKAHAELPGPELVEEEELVATRARVLEASGELREALDQVLRLGPASPEAFVAGSLHVIAGRCFLGLGDEASARTAVERAALSGDKHGWVFPERRASSRLWELALRSGDSRVVRYAERMIALIDSTAVDVLAPSPVSSASPVGPPSSESLEADPDTGGESLIYVTTPQGVARVPLNDVARATEGASLVVDTLSHQLRIEDREVSLERRRALEPLVVQLLRRAREGLGAEEILRAAGGPGPESADAEHRVRVLISRVRDLLGNAAAIERVRDAGEHGKTRYRLASTVRFALIEPLFGGH